MRTAKNFAIASVLLTLVTFAPFTAWGADGIDVIRAGSEDMRAFDDVVAKSRVRDSQNAHAAARAAFGAKVSSEAKKAHDQREAAIRENKNFGQWVKSNNNNAGGQGSAATVVGDGTGTGNDSAAQNVLQSTEPGHGPPPGKGHGR